MVSEHCAGLLGALETELTRNSLAIPVSENAVCSHCSVHQFCFHSTSLHGPGLKVGDQGPVRLVGSSGLTDQVHQIQDE